MSEIKTYEYKNAIVYVHGVVNMDKLKYSTKEFLKRVELNKIKKRS